MDISNYKSLSQEENEIDLEYSRLISEYKQSGGKNKNLMKTLENLKSEPKNKGCFVLLAGIAILVGICMFLFTI